MTTELNTDSLFAELGRERLHLQRFCLRARTSEQRRLGALFFVHGSIENGRVFYSQSGKGLGPFLARSGFDCFVADLRGRGQSTPRVRRGATDNQTHAITDDIPALLACIESETGAQPRQWVGHSWGGVLLTSLLAREPERAKHLNSMVMIGTKRRVRVQHWEKRLKIDLIWRLFGELLTRTYGYLPSGKLGLGSDSESAGTYRDCRAWVRPNSAWIDPNDGFDYGRAVRSVALPPILSITGAADTFLGHPSDVRDFVEETGAQEVDNRVLGRKTGHQHDYDHVNILTHPDAPQDHFPLIQRWLLEHAHSATDV